MSRLVLVTADGGTALINPDAIIMAWASGDGGSLVRMCDGTEFKMIVKPDEFARWFQAASAPGPSGEIGKAYWRGPS